MVIHHTRKSFLPSAYQVRRRRAQPAVVGVGVATATPHGLLSALVYKPLPPEHPGSAGNPFWPQRHCVRAATFRLDVPTPKDVGALNRRASAGLFLENFYLHRDENVVLGGDLSWDDDLDGPLRLRPGWVDVWKELPGDEDGDRGWTYDTWANRMLRRWRMPETKRPDRSLCKLDSIKMVGVEPIPGLRHCDDKGNMLPVLPSHYFGLLLTIAPK